MHAFSRLIKTDLRNRRTSIGVTVGAIILINAAFILVPALYPLPQEWLSFLLTMNIAVFTSILLIPFLHCFSSWGDEWKQRTIYLFLALPVPRAYLLLAKYVAIMLETLLLSAVMIIGLSVQNGFHHGLLFRAEPLYTLNGAKIKFIMELLLLATSIIFISFASVLLGKSVRRFSAITSLLVFIAALLAAALALANFASLPTFIVISVVFFTGGLYILNKKAGVR